MCPHAEHFDGTIVFQNLVNKTVLKIDLRGIGSGNDSTSFSYESVF